jgi:glutathione S-transferase
MTSQTPPTLYYAPKTRASGTRMMLEELGGAYALHVLDLSKGENRSPEFLAINPLGKVPTLRHGETIITEQIAIALYLGDLYPEKGLAPGATDPARGSYLRWMVYYASCFEPALMDKANKADPGPPSRAPYGDYDSMLSVLEGALSQGPYILGERMSLADLQWGGALHWTMMFGLVPERPVFTDFVERITARPSFQKVWEDDDRLAAAQGATGG